MFIKQKNKDIKNEEVRKDSLERCKRGGGMEYQCQIKQNSRPQTVSQRGLGDQKLVLGLSKQSGFQGLGFWSEGKRKKVR